MYCTVKKKSKQACLILHKFGWQGKGCHLRQLNTNADQLVGEHPPTTVFPVCIIDPWRAARAKRDGFLAFRLAQMMTGVCLSRQWMSRLEQNPQNPSVRSEDVGVRHEDLGSDLSASDAGTVLSTEKVQEEAQVVIQSSVRLGDNCRHSLFSWWTHTWRYCRLLPRTERGGAKLVIDRCSQERSPCARHIARLRRIVL